MAAVGRFDADVDGCLSVCVRGLPADLEPERLSDKLHIHFLRSRNGGGEITSVSIKETDRFAIINFEDTKVIHSVLSHCPHILEVDGQEYELSLSLPRQESSLLDKVICDISVTIDCSKLPLGEETVQNLYEQYSGIRLQFIKPQRHCKVYGLYSEVQAFVSHLEEHLRDFEPQGTEYPLLRRESSVDSCSSQQHGHNGATGLHHGPSSQNQDGKASEILLPNPDQEKNTTDLSQALGCSAADADWLEEAKAEALSLIMEADVFTYLHSKSEQYKCILLNHEVNVVDVTSEGVTTLYLQSDAKVKKGSEAEKHMVQACKELRQLYQHVEGNLRRDQIRKSALGLRGGSSEAFKELESLLPKVLLTYDQTHVYIVGESNEVSQAKNILMLCLGNRQDLGPPPKKENSVSSSLSQSYSHISESGTTQMAGERDESREAVPKGNTLGAVRKVRGGEECRLAARFRNSEIGLPGLSLEERVRSKELWDLTTDMNKLAPNSEQTPPLTSLVTVNGEKAGGSQVSVSRNDTMEDILFQKMDSPYFVNTFETSGATLTNNNMESTSTLTPAFKASPCMSLNAKSGLDTQAASAKTTSIQRSPLKRAKSFSGTPSQKQEAQKAVISEICSTKLSTGAVKRQRSPSHSSGKPADEPTSSMASREVTVPAMMWHYMKEAYCSRLDALTSELQVTEIPTDKGEIKVILKGPESSKVEEQQNKLQKLVGMVASDFCVKELPLADVGVAESSMAFKACCSNIRSYFSKISLRIENETLLLIGPKLLCSRASEMLKQAFAHDVSNSVPQVNTVTRQGTIDQGQANLSFKQTQFQRQITPNQTKADTESSERHNINQAPRHKVSRSETRNVNYVQSPKQKPSRKEKNGAAGDLEMITLLNQTSEVNEVLEGLRDDRTIHPSLTSQKKHKTTTATRKQTNLQIHNKPESCVCGEIGSHMVHTSCGTFLCPHCLPLHAECIVCSKTEAVKDPSQKMLVPHLKEQQTLEDLTGKHPKQAQGIQGTMMFTKLPVSLPGHNPYPTAKITYCIPDGIQGEEHPNPGSPFQGGYFEAYLPFSPKGQVLLTCLKNAFKQGLTFRVLSVNNTPQGSRARVSWSQIPHKTMMEGDRSGNGYPDPAYLDELSEALKACGIDAFTD
ncbi:uncharacterized protein si:busm1-163l24.3 [Hoplias malabaricus]|uniref:uncharacterized protein si:busm1-163l24.3 n=1 Tax=Hoplias malabaricus TaxID=27720 RepID=UPI003462AF0B